MQMLDSEFDEATLTAVYRWLTGEKVSFSHGFGDQLTAGFGTLDELGYWQYPMPNVYTEEARAQAGQERILRNDCMAMRAALKDTRYKLNHTLESVHAALVARETDK